MGGNITPVGGQQIQKINEHNTLIDSGSRKEAKNLIKVLKTIGVFPPDIIIVTHAHYDHAQGIPILRREAENS